MVEAGGSLFCSEIHEAPLPEEFKLLSIQAYEGKVDPQDHFNDLMELHMMSDNVKCRMFIVMLNNGAKK